MTDAVRDLTFLHSTDELDRFAACLTLTGGGGTDFRPAFAKIEELRRDGTLRDLQGVLYFTDGKGTYPTRRPPYETAFLFLETGTPPPGPPGPAPSRRGRTPRRTPFSTRRRSTKAWPTSGHASASTSRLLGQRGRDAHARLFSLVTGLLLSGANALTGGAYVTVQRT